jgi:hypothetical protein
MLPSAHASKREHLPAEGLFADHDWRTSPVPCPLGPALAKEVESLGRVLLQFYRAVNLLYRKSAEGKQPEWVARWLDQGKPAELIALQRSAALKNDMPRVIRPDLLVTEHGLCVTELDSVPGGIGLTGVAQPDLRGKWARKFSAGRMGCCAGSPASSGMRRRCISSCPRKQLLIGRR